jgi:hypothetical protein
MDKIFRIALLVTGYWLLVIETNICFFRADTKKQKNGVYIQSPLHVYRTWVARWREVPHGVRNDGAKGEGRGYKKKLRITQSNAAAIYEF